MNIPKASDILNQAFDEAELKAAPIESKTEVTLDSSPREDTKVDTPSPSTHQSDGTQPDQGAKEDELFDSEELKAEAAKNPQTYKAMQADYTRKTQAVAEQRRALEAQQAAEQSLPPEIRNFREMIALAGQKDPDGSLGLVASIIAQAHQALSPSSPTPTAPAPSAPQQASPYGQPQAYQPQYDPYGYPLQPEVDPRLAQIQEQLEQERAARLRFEQASQQTAAIQEGHRAFDETERKYGVTISPAERQITAMMAIKDGLTNPTAIGKYWEFQNQERLLQSRLEAEKARTAELTVQKMQMGNGPTGIPTRAAEPEAKLKSTKDILDHAWRQLERG